MFFSEKIKSIKPNYKVLEIGPGTDPYFRSDILLEKEYLNPEEYYSQIGKEAILNTNKKIIFYDGEKMPFDDNEFDYVICSHVLEHISNIDSFVMEVKRIGKMGYFEFPTIYYDYLYNFNVHKTFLFYSDNKLTWLPKESTTIHQFKVVTDFFLLTLDKGYVDYVNEFKDYFFQGFEWDRSLQIKKADNLDDLCFELSSISVSHKDNRLSKQIILILQRIYKGFKKRISL